MTEIVVIAAVARNRVIGRDNTLIWHIPADMARFKMLTGGHPVIMGRKTWASLPARFRPLPGRRNIVVSRQTDYVAEGAECANSLESALARVTGAAVAFIIGGEQIYRHALPLADRLEITEVGIAPPGDAWFPEIPTAEWVETARLPGPADGSPPYAFVTWRRKTPAATDLSPW